MRTIVSIALALFLTGSLVQCKCKKKSKSGSIGTEQTVEQKSNTPLRSIKINTEYTWPGDTDPFQIISSSIEGNTLKLQVQYGGGCETHDFDLYTNMRWLKSQPPQLNLYLEHNSHGDKCRAMITEDLSFDLNAIKTEQSNTVRLILNNDRENILTYKY